MLCFRYGSLSELKELRDGIHWRNEETSEFRFRHSPGDELPYQLYDESDYLDFPGLVGVYEMPEKDLYAGPGDLA